MAELTYFTVVGAYYASLVDSYDVDTDPDLVPLFGRVRFTPLIGTGDVVKAQTLTPPTNLLLKPVEADTAGVVWSNGSEGVKLVANTAVLELAGALYYQVDFPDGLTARGTQYQVDSFPFLAPTTAVTIDLSEVTPMPGQPATGPVPTSAVLTVNGRTGYVILGPSDINTAIATDPAATWTALGIAPSVNLPSYVDDVLEFANLAAFPGTGETGKIYVAIDTGDSYRWSGSTYIRISDRITASGITDSTATGRAVVTGDAAAGRTALSAASESTLANVNNSGLSLLMDGSYEQDATWWAAEVAPTKANTTLSTAQAYSGTQSLKFTGTTAYSHYPNVTASGKAGSDSTYGYAKSDTGRVYRLSFRVRRAAGNSSSGYVRGNLSAQGAGGTDLIGGVVVNQSTLTTDTWSYYSTIFTVPATGTNAPYRAVAPNISVQSVNAADVFYVDKVRFDDLTDAPVEVLAPPPTGDRTTDTANLQALSDYVQSTGQPGGIVRLRAGTYAADIVTQKVIAQPQFIGQGKQFTSLDGTLKFNGVSSKYSGGWWSDFKFVGSHAGQAAVELNGVCDVHWDRTRAEGTYDVGVWFHNEISGEYAELCYGNMDFYTTVTTALKYTAVDTSSESFHWSGLTGGAIQHSGLGPAILIEANARPYNAPLTVGVWSDSSAYPVIQHNGDVRANFQGHLTVEQATAPAPLAAGTTIYFAGTVSAYMGPALALDKGTLTQVVAGVQAVSGGALTPLPINVANGGALNLFNTADQVTNTEYGQLKWASNVLTLSVNRAGTGTQRVFSLVNGGGQLVVAAAPAGATVGSFQFFSSTATVGACTVGITGTGSASSGTQYGLSISPTYNQSSTAGYTALLINPTETATGSGAKYLIRAQVGGVDKVTVDNTGVITTAGNIELGHASDTTISRVSAGRIAVEGVNVITTSSTDTLTNKTATALALDGSAHTVAQSATISLYNTADQITNYERLQISCATNVWALNSTAAGSGTTRRNIQIQSAGTITVYGAVQNQTIGTNSFSVSTASATAAIAGVIGTLSASSSLQYGLSVSPTFNQSSTAGYTALLVNATETATGSGAKLLADFQVGTTSKAKIDNTGTITLTDAANLVFGTTTGTKIGTGTTQKIGFWNTTPAVQPTAVIDATDATTVITQLNALLARLRTIGLIAP